MHSYGRAQSTLIVWHQPTLAPKLRSPQAKRDVQGPRNAGQVP